MINISIEITFKDRKTAKIIAIQKQNIDRRQGRQDLIYSNRTSLNNTILGTLAEVVIHKAFILVSKDNWVSESRESFGTDFVNHNKDTIELKSTDRPKNWVLFNKGLYFRKQMTNKLGKIVLFCEFNMLWTHATKLRLIGWIPSERIPEFPVNPKRTDISPAFHIPKSSLRTDFETILKPRH
jgi:hypothetical protein